MLQLQMMILTYLFPFYFSSTCYVRADLVQSLRSGDVGLYFHRFKPWAVSLHRLVVRQNVAFGLLIQHVNIVVGQVDDPHPAAGGIDDFRFYG